MISFGSAFVQLTRHGGLVRVSLAGCFALHLGLRLRKAEVYRRIEAYLRDVADVQSDVNAEEIRARFAGCDKGSVAELAERIDALLCDVAFRPLTPRLVRLALGITNRERLRWTKDGRLPPHGVATIRRSRLIFFSTYAVRTVEYLAAHPEIVAAWRGADSDVKLLPVASGQ